MDTSEQYIEMCEKAKEIQKISPGINFGEVFAYPRKYSGTVEAEWVCGDYEGQPVLGDWLYQSPPYMVWLPRQDQLQEMVGKDVGLQTLCCRLYEFSTDQGAGITINGSMEQLWLAFVMHEKFNKVWNGIDWEAEYEQM